MLTSLLYKKLFKFFQSRHGENALIEAVTYRRYDIARTLSSRIDIELDIVDERDRTPFVMATQYG